MYKTRALFIGSNPSQASKGNGAFDSSTGSGRTLHGWIEKAGVNISILHNLANQPTPNNRALTMKEIKGRLSMLKLVLHQHEGTPVVAVGKTAATALTLLGVSFYEMPHPSGLNRLLNDPEYVAGKINGLRDYLSPHEIESKL